jgi:hypothetical protein
MFGLVGLYKNEKMFAALPHTKAMGSEKAVNFKLTSEENLKYATSTSRIIADQSGSGWFAFEIESSNDIAIALEWLRRAYEDMLE